MPSPMGTEAKAANISSLIRGGLSLRRKPIVDFLNVRGAETVKRYRKPFVAPRRVAESKFKVAPRKRGRLGARRWRRVLSTGAGFKHRPRSKPEPLAAGESSTPSPEPPETPLSESPADDASASAAAAAKKDAAKKQKVDWEPLVIWRPTAEELRGNPKLCAIEVDGVLCKWLRPHQREGVRFTAECVLGQRNFDGNGVILADDMGLGKTLQAITLLYTLLRQGFERGKPTVKNAIVVCPTSLVSNWAKEIKKWLGSRIECVAVTKAGPQHIMQAIGDYLSRYTKANVLILSYDTFRRYVDRFKGPDACGLLICDEAHRLKNAKTATYMTLDALQCSRRVLLSGTPMQNDLDEFFAMVNFTNRNVLGNRKAFRRYYENPILAGREPDCADSEEKLGVERSSELSAIVNQFILRRTNVLLSKHLPPKVIQIVCCRPTQLQKSIYSYLVKSKKVRRAIGDGSASMSQILPLINTIKRLCNHPKLIWDSLNDKGKNFTWKGCRNLFPEEFLKRPGHPKYSGKFDVLDRLLSTVRRETDDRVVLVSNYTQTLDVFEDMARLRGWGFVRLDGSIQVKNRQQLVDKLDDKKNKVFLFLLSSKAGGCGLNLVGANRLVLFDPDWNPAVDKQAAARVWRDGQTKRCFVYRFLTTGTIEEKVYQRQLSKEGLQNVLGGAATDAGVSMEDLRDLFTLNTSPSDTHDTLDCKCLEAACPSKARDGVDQGGPVIEEPNGVDKENDKVNGAENGSSSPVHMPAKASDEKPKAVVKPRCRLGQRGRPKEEDLINWAHHDTTATVPDILFRKSHPAVGRENYVSFVFSCEVSGRPMPMQDTQIVDSVSAMCEEAPVITGIAEKKGIEISAEDAQARRIQNQRKRKRRRRYAEDESGGSEDDSSGLGSDYAPPPRRSTRARKKVQRYVDTGRKEEGENESQDGVEEDIEADLERIRQLEQELVCQPSDKKHPTSSLGGVGGAESRGESSADEDEVESSDQNDGNRSEEQESEEEEEEASDEDSPSQKSMESEDCYDDVSEDDEAPGDSDADDLENDPSADAPMETDGDESSGSDFA